MFIWLEFYVKGFCFFLLLLWRSVIISFDVMTNGRFLAEWFIWLFFHPTNFFINTHPDRERDTHTNTHSHETLWPRMDERAQMNSQVCCQQNCKRSSQFRKKNSVSFEFCVSLGWDSANLLAYWIVDSLREGFNHTRNSSGNLW